MYYPQSNPISSTANDTTANWGKMGPGLWFYTQSGCLNNQPSQWGIILNFPIGRGSEVHQIWFEQSSGKVMHRGGNGSGWNGTWKYFSPGTATAAQVLSGYTFSSANGSNLSGSMVNRGALNWSGSNTTYTVPAGYYSGGTLNSKTSYTNGYNAGVTAGKNTALTMKTLTGTTGTSPGTATYTDETGKTKKVQYRTASYNISGTIHAIYMHVTNAITYPSLYTRASGTIFTAQAATGYCIFKAQSPAYVTNTGFNLPIYTDSGPGSKTFSYTIWYSA